MCAFDPNSIKNQPIIKYLRAKTVLIADPISSSRNSVRKVMNSIGIKTSNTHAVDKFGDAKDLLESAKPEIVFCEYRLDSKTGLDLYEMLKQQRPNALERIFILTTDKESPKLAAQVAELDIDTFLVKPYTFADVETQFLRIVNEKMHPSPYLKLLNHGKLLLSEKKHNEALKTFEQAKKEDKTPVLAWAYEGIIHKMNNDVGKARECFAQGLKLDPNNFRCSDQLFDILFENNEHKEAYTLGERICTMFPVTPKRLNQMVRLAIKNQKFDDVPKYSDMLLEMEERDESINYAVAAALVVCGKRLIKLDRTDEAIVLFKKAEVISSYNSKIVKEILMSLLGAGLTRAANEAISRAPIEAKDSNEVRLMFLQQLETMGTPMEVLQNGLQLLNDGVEDKKLYKMLINKSIELKRRDALIEDLVNKAMRSFPDMKEEFRAMFQASNSE